MRRWVKPWLFVLNGAFLAGCASTTVTHSPSPQAPVCDRTATALVLWAPQWRVDQKEIADREAAAEAGLRTFLERSRCFAHAELRRVSSLDRSSVSALAASDVAQFEKGVVIGVRELGRVVKLLSSAALVEGGTEVVLHIAVHSSPQVDQPREFTVHWQQGGPGVIKGVAGLSGDMQSALRAGLQPSGTVR